MSRPSHGYALVIERGETSFGVYAPDLPGCVAVAETREEALRLMEEAIRLHLEGMREDGLPIPEPRHEVGYAEAG